MQILAFGHRSRVGKDTAARFAFGYIKSEYPKVKVFKASFFNPIKDLAADLFGMEGAEFYENHPDLKRKPLQNGKSPVEIWLELGYALRQIDRDCICEYAFRQIPPETDLVIFPDLRSTEEIDFTRKWKAHYVCVERQVPKMENLLGNHPAYKLDSTLDDFTQWNSIIDNNGTLKQLNDAVCHLVKEILSE